MSASTTATNKKLHWQVADEHLAACAKRLKAARIMEDILGVKKCLLEIDDWLDYRFEHQADEYVSD